MLYLIYIKEMVTYFGICIALLQKWKPMDTVQCGRISTLLFVMFVDYHSNQMLSNNT